MPKVPFIYVMARAYICDICVLSTLLSCHFHLREYTSVSRLIIMWHLGGYQEFLVFHLWRDKNDLLLRISDITKHVSCENTNTLLFFKSSMKAGLTLLLLVVLIPAVFTHQIRKCCPTHQVLNQWHSCQNASKPLDLLKLLKEKVCADGKISFLR